MHWHGYLAPLRRRTGTRVALTALGLLPACATSAERRAHSQFDAATSSPLGIASRPRDASAEAATRRGNDVRDFDGSLRSYLRYALEHSPELRAQFLQWRASTSRISIARRWPEPTLTYAFFVRSVETRVGPQRHRFGISQTIPWPSKLGAAADAAAYAAGSERQRLEADALIMKERVARAYFNLWLIEQQRKVLADQQRITQQFARLTEARLEVGKAALSDLNQINLKLSRIVDSLAALDEERRVASARLRATIGHPGVGPLPILDAPVAARLPAESEAELLRSALEHPRIDALELMAKSRRERARAADADRYPGFVVGAEYIETGESEMSPAPEDSGKDPIVVSLAVRLPIWFDNYGDAAAAERAESAVMLSRATAARYDARAELEAALSKLRDAVRRTHLYEKTLVPQAWAAYESVIGGYAADRSSFAAALLAEQELLELQMALYEAHAEAATTWARLEALVGRPVQGQPDSEPSAREERTP